MPYIHPAAALAALAFAVSLPVGAADVSSYAARAWKVSAYKAIPYRLFIPKNRTAGRKYPLMLALHGAGERGNDNSSQLNHQFSNFWADDSVQRDNPAFVVAPQCPANEDWNATAILANYDFTKTPLTENLRAVMDILDSLEKEFPIDKDREYISGMSMGGAATWYALMAFPTRFAAAVPVCGRGDPGQAANLDKINIWTFHAVDDPTMPIKTTRDLVKAIQAVGGTRVKYTEYPASLGYGHESWKPAARDPAMHRWVFAQVRAQATVIRRLPQARPGARTIRMVDGLGRSFGGGGGDGGRSPDRDVGCGDVMSL